MYENEQKSYILRLYKKGISERYMKYWRDYAENNEFQGEFIDILTDGEGQWKEDLALDELNSIKINGVIIFNELEDYSFLRDQMFSNISSLWIYRAHQLEDLSFLKNMRCLNQLLIVGNNGSERSDSRFYLKDEKQSNDIQALIDARHSERCDKIFEEICKKVDYEEEIYEDESELKIDTGFKIILILSFFILLLFGVFLILQFNSLNAMMKLIYDSLIKLNEMGM